MDDLLIESDPSAHSAAAAASTVTWFARDLGIQWMDDGASATCAACAVEFTWAVRRHHCRSCGTLLCDECTSWRWESRCLPATLHRGASNTVRVCKECHKAATTLKETLATGDVSRLTFVLATSTAANAILSRDCPLPDEDGRSAAHFAVCCGSLPLLRWLAANSLSVIRRDDGGETPFALAVRRRDMKMARWLALCHGARAHEVPSSRVVRAALDMALVSYRGMPYERRGSDGSGGASAASAGAAKAEPGDGFAGSPSRRAIATATTGAVLTPRAGHVLVEGGDKVGGEGGGGGGGPKDAPWVGDGAGAMVSGMRGAASAKDLSTWPTSHDCQGTCLVCLDRPACFCFVPCGHIVACTTCVSDLQSEDCPYCRTRSTGRVRTFVCSV